MTKNPTSQRIWFRSFENWSLEIIWSLGFVIWNLVSLLALKQGQLVRGPLAGGVPCPPRTAEVSFHVWILTLANRDSDPQPFSNFLHPLIALLAESFWKEFCLRGRADRLPLPGLETGFNHFSMKRRELCHQLPLNGRPKMEVTERHPLHPCLL